MIALYYRLIIQKFDAQLRCLLRMTRLSGFCANPEQTGDTQVAPTDEIKIFCFIAYGGSFFNRYDIGPSATCCRDARSLQTREIIAARSSFNTTTYFYLGGRGDLWSPALKQKLLCVIQRANTWQADKFSSKTLSSPLLSCNN